MGVIDFCRAHLAVGFLLSVLAAQVARAQVQPVEIVPNVPHAGAVEFVAFSPNGTLILSVSRDGTLKLWNTATGGLVRTFVGPFARAGTFSPDGTGILAATRDHKMKLWDAATGTVRLSFEGHTGPINSVAFSHDGKRVLSGSADKTLKLWDAVTGNTVRTFQGHSGQINSVAFSYDGKRALSGSADKTLKIWDTATGNVVLTLTGHTKEVTSVVFAPSNRILSGEGESNASPTKSNTMRQWNAATGALERTYRVQSDGASSVALSPDSGLVALGSKDGTLKVWNAFTGALVRHFEERTKAAMSVAFSRDGRHVLVGNSDYTLELVDVATGGIVRKFGGHSAAALSVALSPDGTRVLSGSVDGTLKVWNLATGALVRAIEADNRPISSVAFSPDSSLMLSGSKSDAAPRQPSDTSLKLWDTATGTLVRVLEESSGNVASVAFSPDGARIASGGSSISLWDVAKGVLLNSWGKDSGGITSVVFSPDGGRILSGAGDKSFKLWDAGTGALVHAFDEHPGSINSVVFLANGKHVLSACDNSIRLWDVNTGTLVRTFADHPGDVLSLVASRDSKLLLSGGKDGSLKLWDIDTGVLKRTFNGHSGTIYSVALSLDDRRVVSASDDTTIRVWDLASGAQLAVAIASADGEWLTMTPAGFFAASRHDSTKRFLSVVRGVDLTVIDQVHQSLFNPDLVQETLTGDPDGEVARAAEAMNLEKVLDSGPANAVRIKKPDREGSRSDTEVVRVEVEITASASKGVGRIEWRVNGVTAAVTVQPQPSPDRAVIERRSKAIARDALFGALSKQMSPELARNLLIGDVSMQMSPELALDIGDNVVEVVAYNESNVLASLPARTTIQFTGSADQAKPRLHVLAIGIDKYSDPGYEGPGVSARRFAPLNLAVKDARAFGASLEAAGQGMYAETRIEYATDTDATAAGIEARIDKMAKGIAPRDTFILFAAAHGTSERGRFYLIPQDFRSGPNALAEHAIGQDKLQEWVANRIKSKRVLILLDTCESGALVGGYTQSRIDQPASEAAVGRLHEATGRPVLTAAATGKAALEGYKGHGVFTWALLDALRNADTNGNGTIELTELAAHVQALVPKLSAELRGTGRAAIALSGSTTADSNVTHQQSARFGSKGEDFSIVRRLQ